MDLHEPDAGTTQLDLSVDMAGERPASVAHGLRPDRLMRRVSAGIAGGFVAVLLLAWAASGDDEVPRLMKPVLAPALPTAVLGLELVRMDAITADLERDLSEMKTRRRVASRSTSGDAARTSSVPARTIPAAGSAGSSAGASTGSSAGARLRDLPVAPTPDAAVPDPQGSATPPTGTDPDVRALPSIDAPDAQPEAEAEAGIDADADAPADAPREDAEPSPPPSPS